MNWEQLRTILWLRWRLMRNQWRRTGGLGAIIAALISVAAFIIAAGLFVGSLLAAVYTLGHATPTVIMGIWFGVTCFFLFVWMIGLLAELQRSEMIDLQKFLHLPVALGQMFVINYLVSHFTLSIILVVPAMLGLGLGLAISRGPEMLLVLPLALAMVFMITAWTYCLRGWLAAVMTNPRRRRTIIMSITFGIILLCQLPNLYFQVFLRHEVAQSHPPRAAAPAQHPARTDTPAPHPALDASTKNIFQNLLLVENYLPPLWVPVGAGALAEGRAWPALLGTLGCFGLGALGLRRAYRSTLRFYHGETGGLAAIKTNNPAPAIKPSAPRAKNKKSFLELSLPFMPEQSSALALATFQSLLRAPEVKMAWASSFIVTIVIGASVVFRATANVPDIAKPFIATAAIVFPVFFLAQFFANQFGFDRDGFRSLMLSPADRRFILLGKNLAMLPVAATFGALLITLTAIRLQLPPLTILATLFQLATVLLIASLAGNLLSILNPFRIQAGTMKPTKLPGLAMLVLILCQLLMPVVMLPVFLSPTLDVFAHTLGLSGFIPVNLLFSMFFCGLLALAYWLALAPLGRLLHERETKILEKVSVDVE